MATKKRPRPPRPPRRTGPSADAKAGAKPPKPKPVQSLIRKVQKPKYATGSGTGTPTRASATTAPRRPRDVGTPYVPKKKNPRGKVDATRYGRAVGTKYVPKSKLPKTK